MHFSKPHSTFLVVLTFLTIISSIVAHTWIEQLRIIASNGTFTSAIGYPRGNILRGADGFSDNALVYLLPPNGRANKIIDSDPMCRAEQSLGNQTPGSPALSASPGDMIALRYQENGHVTLPGDGKPAHSGTVYIYGTTSPSADDKFLDIHGVWNADGTGGDKRGVLLATRNYDDGQCYQVNGEAISQQRQAEFPHDSVPGIGGDLWCQTDVTIPSGVAASGSYTLYWVWDWPTAPSAGNPSGTVQMYTSCMDITLVPGTGTSKGASFVKGQDLNYAAIATEMTERFNVKVSGASEGSVAANTQASAAASPDASASPAPSNAQPATNPTAAQEAGQATVTVTAPGKTVMVTVTVAGPPATAAGPVLPPSSASPRSDLDIRPFITAAQAAPQASQSGRKTVTDVVEETVMVTLTSTAYFGAYTAMPRIRGRAPLA